jgi:hypothetical protein
MTRTTLSRSELAELEHVERKRKASDRLGRCPSCDVAYLWTAAPAAACLLCGGGLSSTTSSRRAGFYVVEGERLELAQRLPGGLPHAIAWHKAEADRLRQRVAHMRHDARAIEWEGFDQWARIGEPGRGCSYNLTGMGRQAERHESKARTLATRLRRLGDAVEATR